MKKLILVTYVWLLQMSFFNKEVFFANKDALKQKKNILCVFIRKTLGKKSENILKVFKYGITFDKPISN